MLQKFVFVIRFKTRHLLLVHSVVTIVKFALLPILWWIIPVVMICVLSLQTTLSFAVGILLEMNIVFMRYVFVTIHGNRRAFGAVVDTSQSESESVTEESESV